MRVVLLASANSVHTIRWANGLAQQGLDVHLVSLHRPRHDLSSIVTLHLLPFRPPFGYVAAAPALKWLLGDIGPDLLNAHYATGYGLLARLSGFSPSLLSVWGSDVYDFPVKSRFHRRLLRNNLQSATQIGSTSYCMARKVRETLPDARIVVTPFGVDSSRFQSAAEATKREGITIGTVKSLASKYGIDTLIESFARLRAHMNTQTTMLEITGEGPERANLESLACTLRVESAITFHGIVPHDQVPAMLNQLDVFVALSRYESFGVAAVEAAMCGLPVVVSDAEGLSEVVEDGVTGFVVPRNDPEAAARALDKLIGSEALRKQMGAAGRERALALYSWEKSLEIMIQAYKQTIVMDAGRFKGNVA